MSDTERFSVATHLYVRLRRTSSRVIDPVWMARDDGYAREILKSARTSTDPEVLKLVERFEVLMGSTPRQKPAATAPTAGPEAPAATPEEPGTNSGGNRYVRSLR
jgi:hypothetical protein